MMSIMINLKTLTIDKIRPYVQSGQFHHIGQIRQHKRGKDDQADEDQHGGENPHETFAEKFFIIFVWNVRIDGSFRGRTCPGRRRCSLGTCPGHRGSYHIGISFRCGGLLCVSAIIRFQNLEDGFHFDSWDMRLSEFLHIIYSNREKRVLFS